MTISVPPPRNAHAVQSIGLTAPHFVLPTVSFVIPTLNEAENLPYLLPRIPHWAHEIIIVDGRSTDDTIAVARALRDDVRIVLEPKKGKGAALRTGFEAATGDIIIMLDADGSMLPEEAMSFVGALIAGADLVKGSRFCQGGRTDDMSYFRMFGNWGLTQIVKLFYGGDFTDLCYGYMGFWSRHVRTLDVNCPGFEVETLINLRAIKADLKIVEVASFEATRISGMSNLRAIPDGWSVLKTILRERLLKPVATGEYGQSQGA